MIILDLLLNSFVDPDHVISPFCVHLCLFLLPCLILCVAQEVKGQTILTSYRKGCYVVTKYNFGVGKVGVGQ